MVYNITYVTGQQKERMAKRLCGTNMTWLLQKDLFNPFAPEDFAEKRVLKLVKWFSGHCRAIKS